MSTHVRSSIHVYIGIENGHLDYHSGVIVLSTCRPSYFVTNGFIVSDMNSCESVTVMAEAALSKSMVSMCLFNGS